MAGIMICSKTDKVALNGWNHDLQQAKVALNGWNHDLQQAKVALVESNTTSKVARHYK